MTELSAGWPLAVNRPPQAATSRLAAPAEGEAIADVKMAHRCSHRYTPGRSGARW